MNPTLGVVLPVCNAEDRLREQVQQVLDAVTDLTPHFEVVIVDDASTDQTEELAHELATCFPQVRVVRHAERRGLGAACRTGTLAVRGEMIFVQDPDQPFSGTALRHFWLQRQANPSLPALPATDSSLMQRLLQWAAALRRERAVSHPPAARSSARVPAPRGTARGEPVLVRRAPNAP